MFIPLEPKPGQFVHINPEYIRTFSCDTKQNLFRIYMLGSQKPIEIRSHDIGEFKKQFVATLSKAGFKKEQFADKKSAEVTYSVNVKNISSNRWDDYSFDTFMTDGSTYTLAPDLKTAAKNAKIDFIGVPQRASLYNRSHIKFFRYVEPSYGHKQLWLSALEGKTDKNPSMQKNAAPYTHDVYACDYSEFKDFEQKTGNQFITLNDNSEDAYKTRIDPHKIAYYTYSRTTGSMRIMLRDEFTPIVMNNFGPADMRKFMADLVLRGIKGEQFVSLGKDDGSGHTYFNTKELLYYTTTKPFIFYSNGTEHPFFSPSRGDIIQFNLDLAKAGGGFVGSPDKTQFYNAARITDFHHDGRTLFINFGDGKEYSCPCTTTELRDFKTELKRAQAKSGIVP